MAITSESNNSFFHGFRSSHFIFALTYAVISLILLAVVNIYSANVSQQLIFDNRESGMIEKCRLAADEIAALGSLDSDAVSTVLGQLESLTVTRLIVTDSAAASLYDSANTAPGTRILLPEVLTALSGESCYQGEYRSGTVIFRASAPVVSRGKLLGCVYMTEYDTAQGTFLRHLRRNIFQLTLVLELFVIIFSLIYSASFSRRFGKIMSSMRIIQSGNYSHRLSIGGHDELTLLGQEVNDLTERLQTSEETRRRFVSDASHEIKTPLASIKLLSDSILQNDMDAETLREFVGDIGDEADRLNRMSSKLLTLTRMDSADAGDLEIIQMIPTIHRVHRMLQPTAGASRVRIRLELLDDCPVLITEDDLYQIVFNLMENGIKYNTPGGKLTVRLQRNHEDAVLTVTDTGMGIPEDALPHIFDRFFRVDKARSRATGGSGLGLAIVRDLVRNNRGEITVSSTPGKGTQFTVVFPLFDTEAVL